MYMEQPSAESAYDEATSAAIDDILAAIEHEAAGVDAPPGASAEQMAPGAAGVAAQAMPTGTIGHGRIRLRIRRVVSDVPDGGEAPAIVTVREIVGHGTIRLRDRGESQDADVNVDLDVDGNLASGESVGHGPIRFRELSDGPSLPDTTSAAKADILEAIAVAS